ncbi:MAG: bifunctional hydroxymethylpyrimidine kinase/phosphomethylpyrimidine kinase, partial [Lentisphaeria bacterium]
MRRYCSAGCREVMQVVALSIAGSDSSGGAGIQADLRAFFDFGVYGCSVITAVTAQNPHEVSSVFALPESEVVAQISAVMKTLEVKAVKTGMLFSSSIIESVAKELGKHKGLFLVIDPVMVSTSGARLIDEQAIETLREKLLPLATLVTPNLAEAEVLSGEKITSRESLIKVGRFLSEKYGVNFLIKGGHGSGFEAVDMLF